MTTTHRTRAGGWAVCRLGRLCDLRFHFPDMTPAQMAVVPEAILLDMLEIVDPPQQMGNGLKIWSKPGGLGTVMHRDYDLPAVIDTRAHTLEWRCDGALHRAGDRPALISQGYDGWELLAGASLTAPRRQWWRHGVLVREVDDRPDPYADEV